MQKQSRFQKNTMFRIDMNPEMQQRSHLNHRNKSFHIRLGYEFAVFLLFTAFNLFNFTAGWQAGQPAPGSWPDRRQDHPFSFVPSSGPIPLNSVSISIGNHRKMPGTVSWLSELWLTQFLPFPMVTYPIANPISNSSHFFNSYTLHSARVVGLGPDLAGQAAAGAIHPSHFSEFMHSGWSMCR